MAIGLYVHVPFCPQHCPYCAFAVVTGHRDLYERYVEAVCGEMRQWRERMPIGSLQTVFIGGGTPSMLAPAQVQQLLDSAASVFGLEAQAEITLEANPGTVDAAKFVAIRQAGVNRLSLGVQAFHDADLKNLGRLHSAAEAEQAIEAARQAGFAALSIDLIFSIPGSSRERWRQTLQRAIDYQPEHISTYSLTIEEGTRFAQRYHRGRLQPVSEDDDAWAYAWSMEQLEVVGFEHYEVSNFARPGCRSLHNWGYWHGAPYVGVGLSAHSFTGATRSWNTPDIRTYLDAVEHGHSPCSGQEVLDASTLRQEQLWLQIRTCEGVRLAPCELRVLQQNAKFQGMLHSG
ncbi:MAG: radical SAM family heme chaperone HemW, partial [Candidatus Tectomicrobia bacterium]|nr:radical SAM family heme chaperone HemW [Candidatus Tectomicrobia bacterium]